MNNQNILLRHNHIQVPSASGSAGSEAIATILMNIAYYGYSLSVESYSAISKLDPKDLGSWWATTEVELKKITGADRKIDDFVVYKNFPAEVMNKTEAEYWIPQILMYWGFPNELFTEKVQPREKMTEKRNAIVLKLANKDSLKNIFNSYLSAPARWKDHEFNDVLFLADKFQINTANIPFKENLVKLAKSLIENNKAVSFSSATDIIRLAAGISDQDVSLKEKVKFISFSKKMRRFFVSQLEQCKNLSEDVARRQETWKRFLHQLHPGDFNAKNVRSVYDSLYNDKLQTYNSRVEAFLKNEDSRVLELLQERPGEFKRRLFNIIEIFGSSGVDAFVQVLDKLTVYQLAATKAFFKNVNGRNHRVFPPNGNWNKLKIGNAKKVATRHVDKLCKAIDINLKGRLPAVNVLDSNTSMIALPNNGDSGAYARGTSFIIPDNVKFIRTASYWKTESRGNVWFDNGWNFFKSDWSDAGSCSWTQVNFGNGAAVFSGDPTSSKDMQGRAAQLIDLYPNELVKNGVRYAVWSVLCFSGIPFSDAEDVFAALQWGEEPQKGKLFEPSRCQLSFKLNNKQLTKYICVLDLQERKMTYIDANLNGKTQSASNNNQFLSQTMPAFMEYVASLPTVHDLFSSSVDEKADGKYILYSDKDISLRDVKAYVFKPENKDNKYENIDLNSF